MNRSRVILLFALLLLVGGILTSCVGSSEGTAEWYVKQGNELLNQGQYDEAIKNYDEAIRLNPQLAEAYNNRGLAYGFQGKKAEAIADFEKFITLTDNPRWIEMANQQIEELSK